jgi:hypothetical protein
VRGSGQRLHVQPEQKRRRAVIPGTRHSDQAAEAVMTREATTEGIYGALRALFPLSPGAAPRTWTRRGMAAIAQIAAVGLGAGVLLLRIPGLPAWDAVYAEDYWEFLLGAYQHPWRIFVPFGGYEQFLQRVVAQFVAYLPIADADYAFAAVGALITAGCALFIFHASSGHIRSVPLRVLLAAAVILLSSAPMEIADSTVAVSFYLLLAMFWAALWRPRTPAGMATAAIVAFVTAASTSIVILFAPLLAIRVIVLRRFSEHAVTAGWLAGCLIQLPIVLVAYATGQSRLTGYGPSAGSNNRLGDSLTFYAHDVVLRAIGWHLSWRLEALTGRDWATAIVAVALVAVFAVIMTTQPGTRPIVVTALLTGFVFSMVSTILTPWVTAWPVTIQQESAARYTALPIFLIEAAVIIGVDYALRKRRGVREGDKPGHWYARTGLRAALAVTALVVILATSWAVDFRYTGIRTVPYSSRWSLKVDQFRNGCRNSPSGEIRVNGPTDGSFLPVPSRYEIPCARIRL